MRDRLAQYLPPAALKVKTSEANILAEHKSLVGVSEINAKYRYIQLCRGLKAYGITFFTVKVKFTPCL